MTRQRKPRSSIARKLLNIKATGTGKAAGTMTWKVLISCSEQTRWRSSRRRWKLSGLSSKLIMLLTKFASTLTILPRMCEPQGPLIPRKSAKENWKYPCCELTRKQDGCLSQLFSASHIWVRRVLWAVSMVLRRCVRQTRYGSIIVCARR